jgi:outer membrane lipoprotein-sorting protein
MVFVSQMFKKWLPAAVVPVVIAGVVIAVPMAANASGSLPDKTPQEVLALVAGSDVNALSGTFEQTSNLGLPELPTGTGGQSQGSTAQATSALELLTGNHTARVYADSTNGAKNMRLQVLDPMAERDVIRSGSDVWLYDSKKQAATHVTLPAESEAATGVPDAAATQTPDQLAAKLLAAVTPTTTVSVGSDVTVAGRSAYDLVLTPQAGDTLVGSVSIAVDGATGMPLKVEIVPKGSADPAFTTAFTAISFDSPSADLFAFTPPAGTTVTEQAVPAGMTKPAGGGDAGRSADKPVVTGTGWSSIVELNVGTDQSALTGSPLFAQLMTPVDGGNVFSTSLVNVLLTTDGRVFAGSVSAEALQAAASASVAPAPAAN